MRTGKARGSCSFPKPVSGFSNSQTRPPGQAQHKMAPKEHKDGNDLDRSFFLLQVLAMNQPSLRDCGIFSLSPFEGERAGVSGPSPGSWSQCASEKTSRLAMNHAQRNSNSLRTPLTAVDSPSPLLRGKGRGEGSWSQCSISGSSRLSITLLLCALCVLLWPKSVI